MSLNLRFMRGKKSAVLTLALIHIFNSSKADRLSPIGICSFVICLLRYNFFYWDFFMGRYYREVAPQKGFVFLLPGFEVWPDHFLAI